MIIKPKAVRAIQAVADNISNDDIQPTTWEELLRIEKRTLVLGALFGSLGIGFGVIGLSLVCILFFLQDNYRWIIFLIIVVMLLYLYGGQMPTDFRKQLSSQIVICRDRVEWYFRGNLYRSILLDPSVRVGVEYS